MPATSPESCLLLLLCFYFRSFFNKNFWEELYSSVQLIMMTKTPKLKRKIRNRICLILHLHLEHNSMNYRRKEIKALIASSNILEEIYRIFLKSKFKMNLWKVYFPQTLWNNFYPIRVDPDPEVEGIGSGVVEMAEGVSSITSLEDLFEERLMDMDGFLALVSLINRAVKLLWSFAALFFKPFKPEVPALADLTFFNGSGSVGLPILWGMSFIQSSQMFTMTFSNVLRWATTYCLIFCKWLELWLKRMQQKQIKKRKKLLVNLKNVQPLCKKVCSISEPLILKC